MARLDDDSDITSQHWIDSLNTQPKPIVASPAAQISYARPQVYTAPAPVYQPPWSPAPQQQSAIGGGGGGLAGGGGASMGVSATPIAPVAPKINYNSAEYLNGSKDGELDGTFHDQVAMYSDKLKHYINDYESQVGGNAWGKDAKTFDMNNLGGSMGVDRKNSVDAIGRNKDMGLRGLSEDFANRGMVNSGLFNRDYGLSQASYDRQGQNLDQGIRNQIQTLDFNRSNQETDNTAQIGAARRDALNRLAQAQSLT